MTGRQRRSIPLSAEFAGVPLLLSSRILGEGLLKGERKSQAGHGTRLSWVQPSPDPSPRASAARGALSCPCSEQSVRCLGGSRLHAERPLSPPAVRAPPPQLLVGRMSHQLSPLDVGAPSHFPAAPSPGVGTCPPCGCLRTGRGGGGSLKHFHLSCSFLLEKRLTVPSFALRK